MQCVNLSGRTFVRTRGVITRSALVISAGDQVDPMVRVLTGTYGPIGGMGSREPVPLNDSALIVRADLPTPDIVAVRHESGLMTVFADASLSDETVNEFLDELGDPPEGSGHALS